MLRVIRQVAVCGKLSGRPGISTPGFNVVREAAMVPALPEEPP